MKLAAIAASDSITGSFVSEISTRSTLFKYLEFYKGAGNGTTERKVQGSVDAPVARTLGNDYTGKVLSPEYITAGRKIFGDKARMDVAYERMGYDIGSEMESQLKRFINPMVNHFSKLLIHGDAATSVTDFNGLKKLATQVVTPKKSPNGLSVDFGNGNDPKTSQQLFLEVLDEAVFKTAGSNKVILMSAAALARLSAIAREYIQYTKDPLGLTLISYNGVPIVNLEELGAPVFTANETMGTSTDCSSIYVVSFGEKEGLSFFSTEGGYMIYPIQKVGNFYECAMELIADSILFDDKAVTRIEGLRF